MDCYATERHVDWSRRGEVYEFRFQKYGHQYLWQCTEATRRECLHAVTLDAHNRELNLSLVDAVFIQTRIREVIQPEYGNWLEVEAEPIESAVELHLSDVRWLGWVFIVSGGMWVVLGFLVVVAFR